MRLFLRLLSTRFFFSNPNPNPKYTVCAPSRATLMTGYNSGHFKAKGISTNIAGSNPVLVLPAMLKAAGYSTAGEFPADQV